jgi:1-acyl-sn-glycerol-3-phosphate acyltransferase
MFPKPPSFSSYPGEATFADRDAAADAALLRGARIGWALTRLVVHIISGLIQIGAMSLDRKLGFNCLDNGSIIQRWNITVARIMGFRIRYRGTPLTRGCVGMSNHVSWTDVPIIGTAFQTCYVSKIEVRSWPVAGWLATGSGTFYLKRGAGGTQALAAELVRYVGTGRIVSIFPEGTTTDGRKMLRFQPRTFAVPIVSGCPEQPIAIRYGLAKNGRNIAPYVDETTLVGHLLRLLASGGIDVEVTFCTPIDPAGKDRNQLAAATQQAVAEALAASSPALAWPEAMLAATAAETADQPTMVVQ